MTQLSSADYIQEIETWKKASQIHSQRAIEQYKEVVVKVEDFRLEKLRNETLLDHITDIIIVVDAKQNIVLFNQSARTLTNLSLVDVLGKNITHILLQSFVNIIPYLEKEKVSNSLLEHEGKYYSVNIYTDNVAEDKYNVFVLSDVTEIISLQKSLEDEKKSLEHKVMRRTEDLEVEIFKKNKVQTKLEEMAYTDYLTKLPNREAFYEKLSDVMKVTSDEYFNFAVFFIDLDGFKGINDSLGHDVGDKLLMRTAELISHIVRKNDFVARLGGDEFVILLDKIKTKDTAEKIVEKLISLFQKPLYLDEHLVNVTLSIGILIKPESSSDISSILSMADKAMYEVKKNGKNSYMFFNQEMLDSLELEASILKKIQKAFSDDEFYLLFQPICSIDGEVLSSESLSRWKHNEEYISPSEFIPILENKGMIVQFTYDIIDQVYELFLHKKLLNCISINLSMYQFYENNFIEYLEKKQKQYPDFYGMISFEITEGIFSKDTNIIIDKLHQLRSMGYKIYIDDFGTGYSSFQYIKDYPVDVLKIDKIFVDEIVNDEKQYKLLKGIIALASSLDIEVIIEGVETQEQVSLIRQIDSFKGRIQGYYFYKPLDYDRLMEITN